MGRRRQRGGGVKREVSCKFEALRMEQQKRLNETKQSNNERALFSNLSALSARARIRFGFGFGARVH